MTDSPDTVSKLRFLCGSRSNYPVSSSITNADVMALIDALDRLRNVNKSEGFDHYDPSRGNMDWLTDPTVPGP